MIERLLNRCLYHNDIVIDDEVYMSRWFLRRSKPKRVGIRIHHIRLPDPGRDLHDHPFDFVSFILSGGYDEMTPEGLNRRRRFSVARRKAEDVHRISELRGDVWTLVFTGPVKRNWGFDVGGEWMKHQIYATDRAYTSETKRGA